MRLRVAGILAVMVLLASAAATAQTDSGSPPPIRMGLWESQVSVDLSAMENAPPGAAAATHTSVHQACMTPDSWKKSMQALRGRQPATMNCTTANLQQDSHRLSFDQQCSSEQGLNTSVHVEMILDSKEAMHGTATVKMTGSAFPRPISMNSNITSRFVSPDCGDLKPGEQQEVNPK